MLSTRHGLDPHILPYPIVRPPWQTGDIWTKGERTPGDIPEATHTRDSCHLHPIPYSYHANNDMRDRGEKVKGRETKGEGERDKGDIKTKGEGQIVNIY